jgi:1-deoxy-D-xylulose-5-phosphate synthase
VLEALQEADCLTPVERIGWPDKFIEHGNSVESLRATYDLSTDDIVRRIKDRAKRLGKATVEAEA